MKKMFEKGPIDIEIRLRTWASNAVDCLYKTMFLEAADLIQDLRRKHNDDETELQGKGKEQ